jgi:hypothetical protein
MVTPPLVGDLRIEVISSIVGGDAGLLNGDVTVAKTCFMIKARSDHDDFLDLFSIRRF